MKLSLFIVVLLFLGCPLWASGSLRGLTKSVTKKNLVDINRSVVAQQFDFDKNGNIYYAHFTYMKNEFQTKILCIPPSKHNTTPEYVTYWGDSMTLYYASHPTGMAIENGKDGAYVWMCSYSNKQADTRYNGSQTIARIKYQPGACVFPYDKEVEHFWFPHRGDINVAMDEKNDLVAFSFYYNVDEFKKYNIDSKRARRVRIYKLSEALATPLEEMDMPIKWVRGGDGAPHASCDTLDLRIKVHNLSRIQPIAEMGTHTGGDNPEKINSTAWQGFDIDSGMIWFSEGTCRTGTYLTGYDFEGNVVFHRTLVHVSHKCKAWDKWKLGSDKYSGSENEGVRVWKGNLYLDQFITNSNGQPSTSIFRFPIL